MATKTSKVIGSSARKLGVLRLAVTGALAAVVFYVLCWVGAVTFTGPASHMYLQLFTSGDTNSTAALVEGAIWSMAFGLIAGSLVAFFYNAFSFLDRD